MVKDDSCVLEEDCGCITDIGATVPNGYEFKGCKEQCSCSNNVYECVKHGKDVCIHGIGCPCERK